MVKTSFGTCWIRDWEDEGSSWGYLNSVGEGAGDMSCRMCMIRTCQA